MLTKREKVLFVVMASIICATVFGGCCFVNKNQDESDVLEKSLKKAKLFVDLPDYCPTPDALALSEDGSITLSCPNYAEPSEEGVIVKISPRGGVSKFARVPGIEPGSYARPMGIDYAPDGSLYVCAHPRVLRLTVKNGKLVTEVVASGIKNPNGLKINGGFVYVTVPKMPAFNTVGNTGGLYRFDLDDRDVMVNGDSTDIQLIFTAETQNPDRQFGLDGLTFDKKGRILVGDFGDAIIYKLTTDSAGNVLSSDIYADLPDSAGIDGMVMDVSGNLYVTGFSQNQIWKIDKEGRGEIIAEYPDNNGADGELDQPVDLVIYEDKLIISNFDLMVDEGMVNKSHDKPYTLSYIDL